MLFLIEVDSILEKQNCKKYALGTHNTGCIEIVLILLTKIVVLHIKTTIIQVGFLGLERSIFGSDVYFAILLALNKQF